MLIDIDVDDLVFGIGNLDPRARKEALGVLKKMVVIGRQVHWRSLAWLTVTSLRTCPALCQEQSQAIGGSNR